MAEYISREAALEATTYCYDPLDEPWKRIRAIPAADLAPIVHAHWIHKEYIQNNMVIGIVGECSNCRKVRLIDNYCPNCGAKMDEEDKTNE